VLLATSKKIRPFWMDMSVTALWWLATTATVAASVWVFSLLPTGPSGERVQDWETAATRIQGRLGTAEVVLINRAGQVHQAQSLAGLPLVCDEGGKKSKVSHSRRDGLWVVGEKKLSGTLKKAIKKLKKKGTIKFGEVHLTHGWNPPARKRK
jgi:hypothetical protein